MEQVERKKKASVGKVTLDSIGAACISIACLKSVLDKVKSDQITKKQLLESLEHAINDIQRIYENEKKKLHESESESDDLIKEAEIEDAVPDEVFNWLSVTFTRSINRFCHSECQQTFRDAANIVRYGIVVNKLMLNSHKTFQIPKAILENFECIVDWDFNVFKMNEICLDSQFSLLKAIVVFLFQEYDFLFKFKIHAQTLELLLQAVEEGYAKNKNKYHNMLHSADVVQTTNYLLTKGGLLEMVTDVELFATLFAALVHDLNHTGTTNNFHVNSKSHLAMLYNDRSVLENHHIYSAFQLLADDGMNITANMPHDSYLAFRKIVVDIVLATDMSFHFQQVRTVQSMEFSANSIHENSKLLQLLVHAADISNPSKAWPVAYQWTTNLFEEYFLQGDKEANMDLPISPLCDRHTVYIPDSQIGFIEVIVEPTFSILYEIFTKFPHNQESNYGLDTERPWLEHLKKNKAKWKEIIDDNK